MNGINLDPRRLLGFKIVATAGSTMTLQSPKIGVKQCAIAAVPVVADAASAASEVPKA